MRMPPEDSESSDDEEGADGHDDAPGAAGAGPGAAAAPAGPPADIDLEADSRWHLFALHPGGAMHHFARRCSDRPLLRGAAVSLASGSPQYHLEPNGANADRVFAMAVDMPWHSEEVRKTKTPGKCRGGPQSATSSAWRKPRL